MNGNDRLFDAAPFSIAEDPAPGVRGFRTSRTGTIAEHLAIAELLRRGHNVAVPVVDDDTVDLVIDYRTTAQVKSSTLPAPGPFHFEMAGGAYRAGGRRYRRGPTTADVLLCFAHAIDAWWIIPMQWIREAGLLGSSGFSLVDGPRPRSRYDGIQGECREAWHLVAGDWS